MSGRNKARTAPNVVGDSVADQFSVLVPSAQAMHLARRNFALGGHGVCRRGGEREIRLRCVRMDAHVHEEIQRGLLHCGVRCGAVHPDTDGVGVGPLGGHAIRGIVVRVLKATQGSASVDKRAVFGSKRTEYGVRDARPGILPSLILSFTRRSLLVGQCACSSLRFHVRAPLVINARRTCCTYVVCIPYTGGG